METKPEETPPLPLNNRSRVLRDMAVFQIKLFTDGLKDLFLSPLSLMAGLVGVVLGGRNPGALLYRVLRAGQRLEDWINLFSAAYPKSVDESQSNVEAGESVQKSGEVSPEIVSADFDALVDRLQESLLDPDTRNRLSDRSKQQLNAIAAKLRREGR